MVAPGVRHCERLRHRFRRCVGRAELRRVRRHLDSVWGQWVDFDRRDQATAQRTQLQYDRTRAGAWPSRPATLTLRVQRRPRQRHHPGSLRLGLVSVHVRDRAGEFIERPRQRRGSGARGSKAPSQIHSLKSSIPVPPEFRCTTNAGPIGETDSRGQLLVPNLRAYGSNKISIDPKRLPVNDVIEVTEDVVAPPTAAASW